MQPRIRQSQGKLYKISKPQLMYVCVYIHATFGAPNLGSSTYPYSRSRFIQLKARVKTIRLWEASLKLRSFLIIKGLLIDFLVYLLGACIEPLYICLQFLVNIGLNTTTIQWGELDFYRGDCAILSHSNYLFFRSTLQETEESPRKLVTAGPFRKSAIQGHSSAFWAFSSSDWNGDCLLGLFKNKFRCKSFNSN